jgi:hypothetical protein
MVVGDPHAVAEKIVDNIKRLNPSNYTCNFSFGCMPLERAQTSIYRFKKEVLPLVEQAVGPIANIGVEQIVQRKAG